MGRRVDGAAGWRHGMWMSLPARPFPGERAYVSARGNAEVFALEPIITQRAPLLLEELRRKRLDLISGCFNRIHDCSSPAQAVQNGSVRLQAVDNMAKRACGRWARIGRNAAIRASGSVGRFIRHDPAIDGQTRGSNHRCRERQDARTVRELQPVNIVTFELGARLDEQPSRPPRTASALWRCAGQAITDNEPGVNSMECAIAHAAAVVLPTCRAVRTRMDAPCGARRNVSCHRAA